MSATRPFGPIIALGATLIVMSGCALLTGCTSLTQSDDIRVSKDKPISVLDAPPAPAVKVLETGQQGVANRGNIPTPARPAVKKGSG